MDYETLWQTLESLMVELWQKGIAIPSDIADDLKSARTLLTILKMEPNNGNVESQLAMYLGKIEPILLSLAESEVGEDYADIWQCKITDAETGAKKDPTQTSRFISGVPKGEHWLRIKTTDIISDSDINSLVRQLGLTIKPQTDGYFLIYGNQDSVKTFVREVRKKVGKGKLE